MDLYYFTLFSCFSFALGACVASFLNVCIWRIPRNECVVSPPSHCPNCNAPIRWYQNIPIASWLCLRGKCANCKKPISMRYTIVELLGGVLFLLSYLQWALPFFFRDAPFFAMMPICDFWMVPVCWLVSSGLVLGTFIDLEHYYLPDRVTVGGMILGLPLSYLVPELHGQMEPLRALCSSVIGMLSGFFFLWGVGALFSKLFRKEALGFGDVKLIGAVGAFFGAVPVLFTIIVSSVAGSIIGGILILRGKAKLGGFTAVPYGPFLSLGAIVWMYWGPVVVRWYLNFLGMKF